MNRWREQAREHLERNAIQGNAKIHPTIISSSLATTPTHAPKTPEHLIVTNLNMYATGHVVFELLLKKP